MHENISEKDVEKWIRLALRSIKYEDVKNAIENNIYADTIVFNHFSKVTKNKISLFTLRIILRLHWNIVEKYLCNMDFLLNVITEGRDDFKRLFSDIKSRNWLYNCALRAYNTLYNIAWC
ncbi:MAG: hypothetical protein QXJ25_02285 [Candidatus Aenigmatarchaeota archaeon]